MALPGLAPGSGFSNLSGLPGRLPGKKKVPRGDRPRHPKTRLGLFGFGGPDRDHRFVVPVLIVPAGQDDLLSGLDGLEAFDGLVENRGRARRARIILEGDLLRLDVDGDHRGRKIVRLAGRHHRIHLGQDHAGHENCDQDQEWVSHGSCVEKSSVADRSNYDATRPRAVVSLSGPITLRKPRCGENTPEMTNNVSFRENSLPRPRSFGPPRGAAYGTTGVPCVGRSSCRVLRWRIDPVAGIIGP